ncbi:hypothetical protein R3P38DRAFT_3368185 [Favolaschia claudopus]|uniref:Uncharacterized protein n=1 Tax=Favolaschia claudopus TaxID=2862362 RepID=A0AAW0A5Z3_9AGAR
MQRDSPPSASTLDLVSPRQPLVSSTISFPINTNLPPSALIVLGAENSSPLLFSPSPSYGQLRRAPANFPTLSPGASATSPAPANLSRLRYPPAHRFDFEHAPHDAFLAPHHHFIRAADEGRPADATAAGAAGTDIYAPTEKYISPSLLLVAPYPSPTHLIWLWIIKFSSIRFRVRVSEARFLVHLNLQRSLVLPQFVAFETIAALTPPPVTRGTPCHECSGVASEQSRLLFLGYRCAFRDCTVPRFATLITFPFDLYSADVQRHSFALQNRHSFEMLLLFTVSQSRSRARVVKMGTDTPRYRCKRGEIPSDWEEIPKRFEYPLVTWSSRVGRAHKAPRTEDSRSLQ